MDRQSWNSGLMGVVLATFLYTLGASIPAAAQVPVDASGNALGTASDIESAGIAGDEYDAAGLLGPAELAELVGPVALYPDDLLAIVLPASTYPLEIVQAARFLERHEKDSSLQPDEAWDESVTALLNYPEVLRMMDEDIDWTWRLGDAVVNQQPDVINAVESFRDQAYAAGNLKSDQYQTVKKDEGIIEIVPVNDEIIYVPYYEPERVVVRQLTPVYYYYPRPYPVYYYPYPVGYSFYNDYFWGVTTAYRIGWSSHNLHVHHYSYWGHPYYGHSYYGHYYRRPSVHVYNRWYVNNSTHYTSNHHRDGDYWRPRHRAGTRPGQYSATTRSYRSRDVSGAESRRESSHNLREETVGRPGNAPATRESNQRSSQNVDRQVNRSERDSVATRQSRNEAIRFRERPESRVNARAESNPDSRSGSRTPTGDNRRTVTAASRPATVQPARNRASDRDTSSTQAVRRSPATAANNPPRGTIVRERDNRTQPVQRRDDSAIREGSSRAANRQPVQQRDNSPAARPQRVAQTRDVQSAPRPNESRAESRPAPAAAETRREARSDNRQMQASARDAKSSRNSRER